MKYDVKKLISMADKGGYAIPAFNYSDIWEMWAIVETAEEEHSPVMIATNSQVSETHGVEFLGMTGSTLMEHSKIPVINHLDHCFEIDNCKKAIDAGYASVMIDKSHLPIDENIACVREIVAYAAPHGVGVEAELGRIIGKSVEGIYEGDDFLADVPSALRMARESGADYLAVGIGNAHGFYKSEPKLNFQRLAEINEAVDIPLVLHGGTGIAHDDVQKAIKLGINKVNIGTQLHYTYTRILREELNKNPDIINIVDLMLPVKNAIKEEVRKGIRMCMSQGKA
jgi:ketose-bisphosphate aldolase